MNRSGFLKALLLSPLALVTKNRPSQERPTIAVDDIKSLQIKGEFKLKGSDLVYMDRVKVDPKVIKSQLRISDELYRVLNPCSNV